MSIDRSLKTQGSLSRHRNVLTRDERIKMLTEQEKFDPVNGRVFGLPKVGHRKAAVGAKTKKKAEEGAVAAPGAAPAAAASAKGAAPAKGAPAKGTAPAKAAPKK